MASGCSTSVSSSHSNDTQSKTNLYIRGLSPNTTDQDLVKLCQGFGTITSTKAIIDQTTNKCIGYGFVNFDSPGAAERATQALKAQGIQAKMAKITRGKHDKLEYGDLQEITTEKHDKLEYGDLQEITTEKHDKYDVDLPEEKEEPPETPEVMKGTIIAFHRQNHDHYGIYVGDGQMIHYIQDKRSMGTSDAGVKEENLEEVAERKYHECKTLDERFEALPAQQIVDRAKAELSNPKSKSRFKDSKSFAIWCRYDKVDAVPLLVPALCALGVGVFAGAVARKVKGPEELPNLIYPISAGLGICLGSAIALFENFSFNIKLS